MRIDEISNSYIERLRRFLKGIDDLDTLRQALVEADWDDELDQDLKDGLSRVDLFALEVVEGLRPTAELQEEIEAFLASIPKLGVTEITLVQRNLWTGSGAQTLRPIGESFSVELVPA